MVVVGGQGWVRVVAGAAAALLFCVCQGDHKEIGDVFQGYLEEESVPSPISLCRERR